MYLSGLQLGKMANTLGVIALLILKSGSAFAAMYSCVDDLGSSVLTNVPCEHTEKKAMTERQKSSPYSSTGSVKSHALQNANVSNSAQPTAQTINEKCEVAYQKAVGKYSADQNHYPYAQLWTKMGCRSHCEDMLNIVTDPQASAQKREIAASMFSVCK